MKQITNVHDVIDYLSGTAKPSQNIQFHEATLPYGHGGSLKCSCGEGFIGYGHHGIPDAAKTRQRWLQHLEEMILRERREREIYIFEQQTRPHGYLTPPGRLFTEWPER